jgi:hypothetical protein
MSPHPGRAQGQGHAHAHAHAQELVKKQPVHRNRHHALSKSRRTEAAARHGHWRSRTLGHNNENESHHRRAQFCMTLYNPVTCLLDGVEFPSRCDAELAGYDPADCTAPMQPSEACPTTFRNPVLCGNEKAFDNICLASESGKFVPTKDCVSANQPLVAETKCAGKRTKPVKCGEEEREFANVCLARASGFKKSSCVKVVLDESV